MHIGHKLKKLRELKNLTQEYVANQLEITQSNYSRIENNEIELSLNKLEKIADVLEMKPEEILAFDEKYIFNLMHNENAYSGVTINNYYNQELKTLNEKIAKLEALVKLLESKLR